MPLIYAHTSAERQRRRAQTRDRVVCLSVQNSDLYRARSAAWHDKTDTLTLVAELSYLTKLQAGRHDVWGHVRVDVNDLRLIAQRRLNVE